MGRSFFGGNDRDFLGGSRNFAMQIEATPEAFGLTAADAARYRVLHEAYAETLRRLADPTTRTPVMVTRKKAAKRAARLEANRLAAIVRGRPETTPADLTALGLADLNRRSPRVARPVAAPRVRVLSVRGRVVTVEVTDFASPTRRKPAGVVGAAVMVWAGQGDPPQGRDGWTSWETTTGRVARVKLPERPRPGTPVSATAAWLNRKLQAGPLGRVATELAQFAAEMEQMQLTLAA